MDQVNKFVPLLKRYRSDSAYDAAVNGLLTALTKLDESKSDREKQKFVRRAIKFAVSNQNRLDSGLNQPTTTVLEPAKRFGKHLYDFPMFYNKWLVQNNVKDSTRNRWKAEQEWRLTPWSEQRPFLVSTETPIGDTDLILEDNLESSVASPDDWFEQMEYIAHLKLLPGVKDNRLRKLFNIADFRINVLGNGPQYIRFIQNQYRIRLLQLVATPNWRDKYTIRDISKIAKLISADLTSVTRMPVSVARRKLLRLKKLRSMEKSWKN